MRKIMATIAIASMALMMLLPITVEGKPAWVSVAGKISGDITIDGKLAEAAWLDLTPIAMFSADPMVRAHGRVWNYVNASASIRVGWDNDHFYVGAIVHDEELNADVGYDFWQKDCLGVYFFDKSEGLSHKFFACPTTPAAEFYSGKLSGAAFPSKDALVAMTPMDVGYVLEMAIPWRLFGSFQPKSGQEVGFTLLLIDFMNYSNGQFMLVGNGDDGTAFGTLVFAD